MATVLPVAAGGGGCDAELVALSDAPPAANRGKRASSPAGLEPYRAQAEAPAASQLPAVDGEGAAPLDDARDGGGEMKSPDSPRYDMRAEVSFLSLANHLPQPRGKTWARRTATASTASLLET